jgi:hypothetical protein
MCAPCHAQGATCAHKLPLQEERHLGLDLDGREALQALGS